MNLSTAKMEKRCQNDKMSLGRWHMQPTQSRKCSLISAVSIRKENCFFIVAAIFLVQFPLVWHLWRHHY